MVSRKLNVLSVCLRNLIIQQQQRQQQQRQQQQKHKQQQQQQQANSDIEQQQCNRKNRRGEVLNPANTLDGLVARRVDDFGASEALLKRYMSESEAIETPQLSERPEKREDKDPDVFTRTCSICGYQGKWVSEMIRHKRVHTHERPFRCKYCSRTSKWKADVIRHVAKAHGIRVISKYSRSKAFEKIGMVVDYRCSFPGRVIADDNSTMMVEQSQNPAIDNAKPSSVLKYANDNGVISDQKSTLIQLQIPEFYRCLICLIEQDSIMSLISHLRNAHNTMPYECGTCKFSCFDVETTLNHFRLNTVCSRSSLRINIVPVHGHKHTQCESDELDDGGKQKILPDSVNGKLLQFLASNQQNVQETADETRIDWLNSTGHEQDWTNRTLPPDAYCDQCPFSGSLLDLQKHRRGHQMTKNIFNYKCSFCNWCSKRRRSVVEHIRDHNYHHHQQQQQQKQQPNQSIIDNIDQQNWINNLAMMPEISGQDDQWSGKLHSAQYAKVLQYIVNEIQTDQISPTALAMLGAMDVNRIPNLNETSAENQSIDEANQLDGAWLTSTRASAFRQISPRQQQQQQQQRLIQNTVAPPTDVQSLPLPSSVDTTDIGQNACARFAIQVITDQNSAIGTDNIEEEFVDVVQIDSDQN